MGATSSVSLTSASSNSGGAVGLVLEGGLLFRDREGETAGDRFSAVRTDERAATAAALWDPWAADLGGGEGVVFEEGGEPNAEDKAAKASALWVGP